jgi:hypothetical protein
MSKLNTLVGFVDYDNVAEALASVPIPELADWCIVNLVENGKIRHTVMTQSDPSLRYRWFYSPLVSCKIEGKTDEEIFPAEDAAHLRLRRGGSASPACRARSSWRGSRRISSSRCSTRTCPRRGPFMRCTRAAVASHPVRERSSRSRRGISRLWSTKDINLS